MMAHMKRLQLLESQSWSSPHLRDLYSTPDIPGFPWYTVHTTDAKSESDPHVRRHVVPYDFTFKVFVKGRWVGRSLVDVYAEEFAHHTRDYYEACVRTGRLFCVKKKRQDGAAARGNQRRRELKRGAETLHQDPQPTQDSEKGAVLSSLDSLSLLSAASVVDERLAQGDVVFHTVHRHEIPVMVGLTGMDAVRLVAVRIARYGLLCVEKPAGLPTHSSGRYQMNSVLAMLEYVLAPKRLAQWLFGGDALLQGLVDTSALSEAEKQELFVYYRAERCARHGSVACVHCDDGAGQGQTIGSPTNGCDGGRECEVVSLAKAPRPCYRLDKVTSGVLLLGVHQQATKHISQALMAKSIAMEAAVQNSLMRTHTEERSETDGAMAHAHAHGRESVTALLSQPVELRKHYLARTHGTQLSVSTPFAGRLLCAATSPLDGLSRGRGADIKRDASLVDPDLARSWFHAQPFPLPPREGSSSHGDFPSAILVTAPTPVHGLAALSSATSTAAMRVGDDDASQRGAHAEDVAARATAHASACQTAATLCQRIASASSSDESLMHCVPLTGRLHQIRLHLFALGLPIVGDATVSLMAEATRPRTAEELTGASLSPVASEVWHDPLALPSGYRAFMASQTGANDATTGISAEAGEDVFQKVPTPLCYECAGRLPLLTIHDDTAESAVCLHAWEYEVAASVLRRDAKDSTEGEEEEEAEEVGARHRYCFRRGDMVVFAVPVPAWATSLNGTAC